MTMTQKRLAIVCSYNESCGNASYAHVLRNKFSEYVHCDVIPLDLFLLQKSSPAFQSAGDRHIAGIAARLAGYDYVNIQFEVGLYGAKDSVVLRRLKMLLDGCRNVVVTMHRINPPTFHLPRVLWQFAETFVAGHPIIATRALLGEIFYMRPAAKLYSRIIEACRGRSRSANVSILVHTKRERRIVKEIYGFDKVVDFPITFLTEEQRRDVLEKTDVEAFRQRHGIAPGTKVIGAFGFISSYKGYETLIHALKELPDDHHLYLFGGQHPASVAENVPLDPYIESLLKLIREKNEEVVVDARRRLMPLGRGRIAPEHTGPEVAERVEDTLSKLLSYDLLKRVHFVGELSDPQFIEALRGCDAVVLPYLEVGQSMSGVIALAIECGANLYCARNRSFAEVMKYYGEVFVSFDIGNYVELAQKIQRGGNRFEEARSRALATYNLHSNVALHLERMGFVLPAEAELPRAGTMQPAA
jgi:glycosyltransferase involved in cell wall biosynthesis